MGNRTRRRRTVPLLYLREDSDYVVIASYGGRPHHPDWYLNLVQQPRARIQVGRFRTAVEASTVNGPDRNRLWSWAVAAWPDYEQYQARTTREIPVVRLRPVDGDRG